MTETTNPVDVKKEESANTLTPQQQFDQVKNALKTEIALNYKNFVNAVQNAENIFLHNFKCQFNPTVKAHAFLNLDQGIMWLEKCFDSLQQLLTQSTNGLDKSAKVNIKTKKNKKYKK